MDKSEGRFEGALDDVSGPIQILGLRFKHAKFAHTRAI